MNFTIVLSVAMIMVTIILSLSMMLCYSIWLAKERRTYFRVVLDTIDRAMDRLEKMSDL